MPEKLQQFKVLFVHGEDGCLHGSNQVVEIAAHSRESLNNLLNLDAFWKSDAVPRCPESGVSYRVANNCQGVVVVE